MTIESLRTVEIKKKKKQEGKKQAKPEGIAALLKYSQQGLEEKN